MSREALLTRFAVFLVAALSCPAPARAQSPHPYAGGAVEISSFGVHSWSGSPSVTYTNTADDPAVIGIVGEGGVFLGNNIAVGAEVDMPLGRTGLTQAYGYFNPYRRLSQYREWSAFGIVHGDVPSGRRIRVGALAGAGVVVGSSLDRFSQCPFGSPNACSPFGPEQETTRTACGTAVGGDVVFHATRHLGVLSEFRVVWVDRGGEPASASAQNLTFVSLGLDSVSYRARFGLRATF